MDADIRQHDQAAAGHLLLPQKGQIILVQLRQGLPRQGLGIGGIPLGIGRAARQHLPVRAVQVLVGPGHLIHMPREALVGHREEGIHRDDLPQIGVDPQLLWFAAIQRRDVEIGRHPGIRGDLPADGADLIVQLAH